MKKALFIIFSSVALVLLAIFIIWARLSGNRWMVYIVPPLAVGTFFVGVFLIDIFSRKK